MKSILKNNADIPSQHLSCIKNEFDFPMSPALTAAAAWQQNILIIGTTVNLYILFLILHYEKLLIKFIKQTIDFD